MKTPKSPGLRLHLEQIGPSGEAVPGHEEKREAHERPSRAESSQITCHADNEPLPDFG